MAFQCGTVEIKLNNSACLTAIPYLCRNLYCAGRCGERKH